MKFRYKAPYNSEVVSFDPGSEIVCPLCGAVEPVPLGWKTHQTIKVCLNNEHHANDPEYYHRSAFFDINSLLGADEFDLVRYMVGAGIIFEEDFNEWHNKRTLWHTMYTVSGPPKWKIEPDPFWRRHMPKAG